MSDNISPSPQYIMPSGITMVGAGDQINSPSDASTGGIVQQGQQMLSGSDKNTPPGPPIFKWDKYQFMWHCYWGTGGFYDGTVLLKMRTELDDQYLERRSLSYYRNFFREIIDATYKPVFAEGATRTITVNGVVDKDGNLAPTYNNFLNDVDNRKHSMSRFMKRVARTARTVEVCYIIIDNFAIVPENTQAVLKDRAFPYVYLRLPSQVETKELITDEFNKIVQITFKENPVQVPDPKNPEKTLTEKRWKRWTLKYSVLLRQNEETKELEEIAKTKVVYDFGEVPIVVVMSSDSEDDTVLPHPSFYDVARCNWAIFNWDSAQGRAILKQMYNVLILPKPETADVSNLQSMGPQQGLYQPPAQDGIVPATPQWLEYPTGNFEAIATFTQQLIDDLFRQCGQLGVSGTTKNQKTQSGVSKQYDFYAKESVLKETAKMIVNAEQEIARIFQLYVINEPFEIDIAYEEDYGPEDDAEQDVQLYTDFINSASSYPKARALAVKMMSKSVFDDAPEEELQEVLDEIDQVLDDELHAPPEPIIEPATGLPIDPSQAFDDAFNPNKPLDMTPKKVTKIPQKRGFSLKKNSL